MGSVSLLRLGKAVLLSVLTSVILLLLLAYFAYRSDRPMEVLSSYALAATLIGAWLCGLMGARSSSTPSLWWGLLCGVAYFLLVLLSSLFFAGEQIAWPQRLFVLGVGSVCVLVGAFLGAKRRATVNRARSSVRRARRKMRS